MIETLIGQRYRIKALIGEGGMASVYLALDEKLERKVAIKIMHPHLARNDDIRERFLLEARTVSGLDHPNILRVYDFSGLDSEQLWIVMEILYGDDLSEYVKAFPRNRLQFIVATLITREICRALHEAHKLNVVHRDIKPENIMMLQNGQIKLMDFGIAKVHRANATQTGIFMGSPSYMSPEQIRGTDVDSRADIYSLSVLFYEIVTGQLPFVGKSTAEVINRIMVGRYTPPNLLITDLPPMLTQVIAKGMQHHKDERYGSITEMALALDNFLASINFRESRLELEEFSLNRTKFEERIAEALTLPPAAPHALPAERGGTGFSSQVSRYQASYETPPMESSTMLLDQANSPTIPPDLAGENFIQVAMPPNMPQSAPQAPPMGRDESEPKRKAPKVPTQPPLAEQKPSPRKSSRAKQTSVPPGQAKAGRHPTHFHSPMRKTTQPPRTPNSSPRATQHRAVFREFEEGKKKSSNFGLIVTLFFAAAVAAFFIFGTDKFSNRFGKSPTKIAERQKPTQKSEKEAETPPSKSASNEAPDTKVAETEPSPTPAESTPPAAEAQTSSPPVPATTNKPAVPRPRPVVASRPPPTRVQPQRPAAEVRNPISTQTLPKPRETTLASIPPEKPSEDRVPEKPNLPSSTPEREKPAATGPGLLKLAALPAAEVYLDGKLYGTTNDKQFGSQGIKLDSGTYMLRLKRRGYRTEEQAIQIKPGEMRQINVSLTKLAEFVELTIRVNKLPANVTIEETRNGGRKRDLPMGKHSLQVNLKPGNYKVNVAHGSESINRTLELTEENKSITFNADFK